MATLLPPAKRRKLYYGVPEPAPKPAVEVPNIVVQFVNEEDGKSLAPTVNLRADLSRDELEALLNKLSRKVSTPFTVVLVLRFCLF
jgi:ribosome assembly protein 4